jgi:hypothetical protein
MQSGFGREGLVFEVRQLAEPRPGNRLIRHP